MDRSRHLARPDYVARREAREAARAAARRKRRAAVLAVALVGVLAVGGTVAWLTDETDEVTNVFGPAGVPVTVVEKFEKGVKSDVRIQNEGNVDAYVRAYVAINWVDDKGNIVVDVPGDYICDPANPLAKAVANGWAKGSDGYWYYLTPVEPDDFDDKTYADMTGVLIESVKQTGPDNAYALQVDIVAQSVQADGADEAGVPAVVDAWDNDKIDITVNADGSLTVAAQA